MRQCSVWNHSVLKFSFLWIAALSTAAGASFGLDDESLYKKFLVTEKYPDPDAVRIPESKSTVKSIGGLTCSADSENMGLNWTYWCTLDDKHDSAKIYSVLAVQEAIGTAVSHRYTFIKKVGRLTCTRSGIEGTIIEKFECALAREVDLAQGG